MFQKLIDFSHNFDFCFTVAKNDDKRLLIHANEVFFQSTGYKAHDVLNKNCKFLQGGDTDPQHVENIRNSMKNKEATFQEIINYKKNGEPFVNRLIIIPVKDHIFGIQSIVEKKEKLLSLKDLQIDVADINHYINNPLNIVTFRLEKGDIEKAAEALNRIRMFLLNAENPDRYPAVY